MGAVMFHPILKKKAFYGTLNAVLMIGISVSLMGLWTFHKQDSRHKNHKLLWIAYAWLLTAFAAKLEGMTGVIFGSYGYTEVLSPVIMDVPLAVPFGWITALFLSAHVTESFIGRYRLYCPSLIKSFVGGGLMVLFDLCLEPYAIKSAYWVWYAGKPSLHNSLAWFGLRCSAAFFGEPFGLILRRI